MELMPTPEEKHLITEEERGILQRTLGSLGLYDASMDFYDVPEHPEDERWIVRGLE